ncbi:MAG: TonB-dependent receptor [Thermodesulfovibrionales bacterium]
MRDILKIILFALLGLLISASLAMAEEIEKKDIEKKTKEKEAQLEEIVVTVTGKIVDEATVNMPAVVESLTPEGIERINAIDTSDIFKYMPGSYLRKLYPGSNNSPLVIRGNNSTMTGRTLVIADGLRLSDFTATGNSNAPKWQMVFPGEIETMDMIYGPFSAALSGNSMSGTAVITTHMPMKREVQADTTYTFQSFREFKTDADLNSYNANAYYGDKIGPLSFSIWADLLKARAQGTSYITVLESSGKSPGNSIPVTGWVKDEDSKGRMRYILGAQGVQDIANTTGKIKLGYDLTPESQVRLTLGFWDSTLERNNPQTYLLDSNGNPVYSGNVNINGKSYTLGANAFTYTKLEKQDLITGLTYSYNSPNGIKVFAGVSSYSSPTDITSTSNTSPPASAHGGTGTVTDNDNGWYTADLKGSYEIKGIGVHTVGAGYHYDRYYINSEAWNASDWKSDAKTTLSKGEQGKTQTHALFIDDTWDISKQWSVYLGGRYECWEGFDASKSTDSASGRLTSRLPDKNDNGISPKLSATFRPSDEWRIRLSLALATRYPTVGELYYGGITSSGIINNGNPDMKPEKDFAKDFTITRTIGETGEARLTFFEDYVKDAIYSQTNTYTNVTNFQNVDKVRTRGIEVAFNERKFLIDGLGVFANLAWTDSEILANENVPASVGKDFPRVPHWRVKGVLDYTPTDRLFMTFAGHYSGKQHDQLDNSDSRGGYGGLDEFLVFDTKVSYLVMKDMTASIGIDNITDQLYHVSHPYPRRTYFASLKYTY